MSDETPTTGDATPSLEDATPAIGATPRSRPANASAAAARRARQMGGPRPSVPAARPDDAPAAAPAVPTAPPRRRPSPTSAPVATKPASSVGKKARPRPRPTPAAVEEPGEPEKGSGSPSGSRRLVGAGVLLSGLLIVAGVVFLVLALVLNIFAGPAISQEETDRALSAAKSDVALVTSYGYQTVDADAAKAAAVLTGQFKTQYLDSIKTVVKPQLPTSETVTTGQVDTAGLVSADSKGRQVVVLVYGQQSVTNKAQTTPRIDAFQIRVTMQLVGDTWLVSQLDQLGNNA